LVQAETDPKTKNKTVSGNGNSAKGKKKRVVVNLRKEEDKKAFEALKNHWELQFDYEVLLECFRLAVSLNQEGILKDDRYKKRFQELKDQYNLDSDLALIKLIVHRYFALEEEKAREQELKIEPSLELLINDFLQSHYYKMKYGIFNKTDFINRATLKFYESIRSEINLHNATFRSSLPEKEKLVAQALMELLYQLSGDDTVFGVARRRLLEYLGQGSDLTEEEIKKILFSFENRQLVNEDKLGKEIYYTVPL